MNKEFIQGFFETLEKESEEKVKKKKEESFLEKYWPQLAIGIPTAGALGYGAYKSIPYLKDYFSSYGEKKLPTEVTRRRELDEQTKNEIKRKLLGEEIIDFRSEEEKTRYPAFFGGVQGQGQEYNPNILWVDNDPMMPKGFPRQYVFGENFDATNLSPVYQKLFSHGVRTGLENTLSDTFGDDSKWKALISSGMGF